jgi:ceramide glucosyltransferase
MTILFWTCAVLAAAGMTTVLLQYLAVRQAVRERLRTGPEPADLPPVSVLKPLKGIDDNLFDNLTSFCTQDYPEYEVIFSLQDGNDPAAKIARKVAERHPGGNITIVIERCGRGKNPKVNNLIPAYRASRYDTVLVSDSNVQVGPDYLRAVAGRLREPGVGLVSNVIRGTGGRSLGAVLENLHLNTFIAGSVCFLDRFLKIPCVIGKSMLMRKRDLEAIGGLEAVKDVLAEDFIIGREMRRSGKRVALSAYQVQNVNQHWTVRRFLNRHTRWAKLRWKIGGLRYLAELLANPVLIACLPLLVGGLAPSALALAGATALAKTALDRAQGVVLGADLPARAYALAPFKDLLIGALWAVPLLSATVLWRGGRYRIVEDSRLVPVEETGVLSWRFRIADAIRERFA